MAIPVTNEKLKTGTYLERGVECHTSTLTASYVKGSDYYDVSKGKLPYIWQRRLMEVMMLNPEEEFYIVFSYLTPIAWRLGRGQWTIPEVKYSVATSRHQNIVRLAAREGGIREWTESTG